MSEAVWGKRETEFFYKLTPEVILNAVEELNYKVTGRCLTLNSMENRVFEVEVEINECVNDADRFVVVKFYRPGRWSKDQILDEHKFLLELEKAEIPVIAPILIGDQTLFEDLHTGLFYCLFPKKGGRMAQELSQEQIEVTGRLLARIHNVGSCFDSCSRIRINPSTFGIANLNTLLESQSIPGHLSQNYQDLVENICELSSPLFDACGEPVRIHGDCHWGNVIVRDNEIFFIDFDDMLIGPPVQDIWLILPGRDEETAIQRNLLLDAYETMRDFDFNSLRLIEPLRALRYIHFSAWIAKRWEDQAFQNAFPHFADQSYWDIQIQDLKNQLLLIQNQSTGVISSYNS